MPLDYSPENFGQRPGFFVAMTKFLGSKDTRTDY